MGERFDLESDRTGAAFDSRLQSSDARGERDDATRAIGRERERVKGIAQELARRASPGWIKTRAKEVAVEKTVAAKDRVVASPLALGLLAGGITCGVAMLMKRRRPERGYEERDYLVASAEAYGDGGGYARRNELDLEPGRAERLKTAAHDKLDAVNDALHDKVDAVKERAASMRDSAAAMADRAGEGVANLRDRLPSAEAMFDDVKAQASAHPAIVALCALLAGAAIGLLLPVSDRERRVLQPVHDRATSATRDLKDRLQDQIAALQDRLGTAGVDLELKVENLGQKVAQRVAGRTESKPNGFDTESDLDRGFSDSGPSGAGSSSNFS